MKKLRTTLAACLLSVVAVMATSLPASAHTHEDICIDLGYGCGVIPDPPPIGGGGEDPCRTIFSDGICSTAEHPWPLVWGVTDPVVELVICTISLECSPTQP